MFQILSVSFQMYMLAKICFSTEKWALGCLGLTHFLFVWFSEQQRFRNKPELPLLMVDAMWPTPWKCDSSLVAFPNRTCLSEPPGEASKIMILTLDQRGSGIPGTGPRAYIISKLPWLSTLSQVWEPQASSTQVQLMFSVLFPVAFGDAQNISYARQKGWLIQQC